MKKPYWRGVFPAITTQMKKDGTLDLDATARHATALVQSGVAGVIFGPRLPLKRLGMILNLGS